MSSLVSRYAPAIAKSPEDYAYRFWRGLRKDIRKQLSALTLETQAEILAAARKIEACDESDDEDDVAPPAVAAPPPPPRAPSSRSALAPTQNTRFKKPGQPSGSAYRGPQPPRQCTACGKTNHIAKDCWRANGKCVLCGSGEHLAAACPRRRNQNGGQSSHPLRQNFTLAVDDAKATGQVITGESLSLSSFLAIHVKCHNYACTHVLTHLFHMLVDPAFR